MRALVLALVAAALLSCDAFNGLIEPHWEPAETNGTKGQLHFVVNPYALHRGQPEQIRVERIETRSIKKGATVEVQKRERKVRVVMAVCESASICDAVPGAADTREIVVTPKALGGTNVTVTAVVDEKEQVEDSIAIRAQ